MPTKATGDKDAPRKHWELHTWAKRILAEAEDKIRNLRNSDIRGLYRELSICKTELELQRHNFREAYKAIEVSRSAYCELFNSAPFGYITTNEKGIVLEANRAAAEILGVSQDTLPNTSFARFSAECSRDVFYLHTNSVMRDEIRKAFDMEIERQNGSRAYVHIESTPVIDSKGKAVQVRSALVDVTESRRVQSHLALSDRLTSMGMLAAGVAHEINNPLTYVLYNLETLAVDLPMLIRATVELQHALGTARTQEILRDDIKALEAGHLDYMLHRVQSANEGACRVRDIVRELMEFTCAEDDRMGLVSLNDIINTALTIASNEIKYRAKVVKDFSELPTLLANDGKLAQVFLNIIVNAVQAIEEGNVENNEIRIRTWAEDKEVIAEISDTGEGISKENLAHIFDPFFTTKEIGARSGLGLSICQNIVASIGGEISVESKQGKGTRFSIRVPIKAKMKPKTRIEQTSGGKLSIRGRVLIVDDEPQISELIAQLLSDEHETVAVTSGNRALEILKKDQSFDSILCDLMMPDFTGMDLYDWLFTTNPGLANKMIFITGGAFTPKARNFLEHVKNPRLEKPLDPILLRSQVRKEIIA